MFDGVPEQFHQFIAPRTTSSLPLHLSFPLHPNSNAFPPTPFDAYNYNNTHLPLLHQPNLLHPNHYSPTLTSTLKHYQHKDSSMTNLQEMNEREASQLPDLVDSCTWTHDEVLALFRIRSTMDTTWFPDLTWEHVSRKLAEVGFKRSAEKCKEKFEEESRYLSNINYNVDNYRFLSEQLEQDLYQAHDHQPAPEVGSEKAREREEEEEAGGHKTTSSEEPKYSRRDTWKSKERKRKKLQEEEEEDEFEMLKGFCEKIVNKMMAQQEEMHNKLLEDMVKRDGEKFAREEAWKKQEIERMNKELQMMAQEQVVAGDRQATVIEFLKKLTATSNNTSTCSPCPHSQNPNDHFNNNAEDDESMKNKNIVIDDTTVVVAAAENPIAQKPSSVSTCTWSSSGKGDNSSAVGRRWPRDEVLALINLRCSVNSNVNDSDHQEKEVGNNKAPLWERISQGMSDLGYKRSAKRCKEKWENINKYFRKTKDINKKRSLHSRTCPYFHQLTTLYTQGKLIASQTHSHPPPHPHSG